MSEKYIFKLNTGMDAVMHMMARDSGLCASLISRACNCNICQLYVWLVPGPSKNAGRHGKRMLGQKSTSPRKGLTQPLSTCLSSQSPADAELHFAGYATSPPVRPSLTQMCMVSVWTHSVAVILSTLIQLQLMFPTQPATTAYDGSSGRPYLTADSSSKQRI